ncbi:RDD family protein [Polaribacter sp. MSW13]|uniref:RDD family protein n=1 Tax=Polaribacter marinus TaxID=2916838 RepID=A0A9X1VKD5_9FLAO|nr:RDD family protein [Polaribacter marinus]MCI2227747.1 RDD family protein [Polaribacter marinus]
MLEEFENYYKRFEKASIGRRIVAAFVDFFIYYLTGVILGLIFNPENNSIFSYHLEGIPALISFCLLFFLWPISEGIWGQTIGKRFLDIKVVTKKNEPITMGQAFIRFFLGFLDFFLLIGIIVAALNKDNQRIGDAAAGTFVVKSKYNG